MTDGDSSDTLQLIVTWRPTRLIKGAVYSGDVPPLLNVSLCVNYSVWLPQGHNICAL